MVVEKKFELMVCPDCGGYNVQFLDWVDANFDKLLGGSEAYTDSCWCEDCEKHYKYLDTVDVSEEYWNKASQERS